MRRWVCCRSCRNRAFDQMRRLHSLLPGFDLAGQLSCLALRSFGSCHRSSLYFQKCGCQCFWCLWRTRAYWSCWKRRGSWSSLPFHFQSRGRRTEECHVFLVWHCTGLELRPFQTKINRNKFKISSEQPKINSNWNLNLTYITRRRRFVHETVVDIRIPVRRLEVDLEALVGLPLVGVGALLSEDFYLPSA